MVDHYTEFFKRVRVTLRPVQCRRSLSTDGVHFDRPPTPEERLPLLAYLKTL